MKKKWYQKSIWIILLLIFFFPAGIFLMWRHTNWKGLVKVIITGFWAFWVAAVCLTPTLESATLTADTSVVYDVDEQIELEFEVAPDDYSVYESSFYVTGGKVEEIDGKFYFLSDEPGTFEVRLGASAEKCNTLVFNIEDKTALAKAEEEAAEKRAEEKAAKEKAEKEAKKKAEEKAKKEAEEKAAKEAEKKAEEERLAKEKAEQERIAAEQAEQERIAAEQAEQERIAAELAEQQRIAAEQAEQQRIAAEQAEQARIAAEQAAQQQQQEQMVWISATGSKYHSRSNCGNMNPDKAYQLTLSEAQARGYDACKRCH